MINGTYWSPWSYSARFVANGPYDLGMGRLPGGNDRRWHQRRWRDNLGYYYRARSMENPNWYDPGHLVDPYLRWERGKATGAERDLIDEAIEAAKAYGALSKRGLETDEAYRTRRLAARSAVFGSVDTLLQFRDEQRRQSAR